MLGGREAGSPFKAVELLPRGVVRKLYENKTTEIVVLVEVCNVMSCWRGRQKETDEANRGKKRVKRFVEIVVSKGNKKQPGPG